MSDLVKVFDNKQFGKIRMVVIGGKPYAVGVDVAKALEYANPAKAIIDHCDGFLKWEVTDTIGRNQETKVIPQGDIIRLIVGASRQSKNEAIKEKAKKFESWIFDEVIPTVLETGSYNAKQTPAIDTAKEMRAEAMLRNARVRQAKLLQELAQSAVTDTAKQILVIQAANITAGEKILALPKADERATTTATELCHRYHLKKTWATALGRKLNERLERNSDTGYNTQTVSEVTHKEVKQWNWYVDKVIPVMDEMQGNGIFDGHYED